MCVVRHPLSWYRSYWTFKEHKAKNWRAGNPIDKDCRDSSFEGFILKVLKHHKVGIATKFFRLFCKHATFISRCEHLTSDLSLFLRECGEIFDDDVLWAQKPSNKASTIKKLKGLSLYPESLAKRIMEIDSDSVCKYGYNYIPEDCIK
jgi:hypothetical protein